MAYLRWNPQASSIEKVDGFPAPNLVAWGVRHTDGEVVYALPTLSPPGTGTECGIYDTNANNRRKVQFESELAAIVIKDPSLVAGALRKVNQGIIQLLNQWPDQKLVQHLMGDAIAKMMYSNRHFGVLGSENRRPQNGSQKQMAYKHVWDKILQNSQCKSVETVILLHQAINQEVFPKLSSKVSTQDIATLTKTTNGSLRPKELFENRGRVDRSERDQRQSVSQVGIFALEDLKNANHEVRQHSRAVDGVQADADNPSPLSVQMKELEMPFVAGPSGSAGSALACALIAARLSGEDLKKYALACVAYLVGGGSHGFHEVMVIARLAGMSYTDGNYVSALPDDFKSSSTWRQLKMDYADVIFEQWLKGKVKTPKTQPTRRITPTLIQPQQSEPTPSSTFPPFTFGTANQHIPFTPATTVEASSDKKRSLQGGKESEQKRQKYL